MEDVREALLQVIEGRDFTPPEELLRNIKPEKACTVLPGLPYSLATNVLHADIWNRVWLHRLEGKPKFNPFPDFPAVSPEEWPGVRDAFLVNLNQALEIANTEPFQHKCRKDETARKVLLQIAVHTAYHLGQIKLLKRALSPRSKDE